MKATAILSILLASTMLPACSSLMIDIPHYDELLKSQTEQDGRACIRQTEIRGYGVLDDDVISVDGRGKRYYLLTTILQCNSLQTGFAAGFDGRYAELCGGGRDKIVTSEESCPIDSIFEFESRESAFAAFELAEQTRKDLRAQHKLEMESAKSVQ